MALPLALWSGISGCGVSSDSVSPDEAPVPAGPLRLDIFSARGFLGGSDYERYVIEDDVLWRECGTVNSGKNRNKSVPPLDGDAVLSSDPQLTPTERRVEALSAADVRSIKRAVVKTLDAAETERGADGPSKPGEKTGSNVQQISLSDRLPPPGSIFSLVSPGVFELSASLGDRNGRFVTAVDSVAEKGSAPLTAINTLFATVRGIGPVICGSQTFFGVGRGSDTKKVEAGKP